MAEKTGTDTKNCKYCKMEIPKSAKVCPHCRKKQKKGIGKWILLAIIVLVIIGVASGGSKDKSETKKVGTVGENAEQTGSSQQTAAEDQKETAGSNQGTENTSSAAAEDSSEMVVETEALKEVYHVGDVLQDGDMQIVYMASGNYNEANEFLQPREGYRYVFLQLAFENISKKNDVTVSTFGFEGYADGYSVDPYFGGEDDLSGTLSPGRTTSGFIYYEIPDNTQSFEVEYETNFLTKDKLTFAFDGDQNSGYTVPKNTSRSEGAVMPGGTAEDGEVRIAYLSCSYYQSDNQFVQPHDGYQYVSCELEFENLQSTDMAVSSLLFDCYADGINCAQTFIRDDDISATISSGRKAKGTVTFEVPDSAEVVELEYLTNAWTSKRIVFTVR